MGVYLSNLNVTSPNMYHAIFPKLKRACCGLLTLVMALLVTGLGTALQCNADQEQTPAAGTISLYVDGRLQATAKLTTSWQAMGHTELGRGLFNGNPADFVNGLLGDVRLYDRALTTAQVNALYSQGPQAPWQLDQTAGRAAGAANQWQLQGGAHWLSDQNGPLSLNGTGAFADAGRGVLDTSRSYTVSAWVSFTGVDGYQTLISQDGKSLSGFYLQKRGDDGKFALAVREADAPNAPLALVESSSVPQVQVLYHVVGVYRAASTPALPTSTTPVSAALLWDADRQGRFLESLAQDREGRTWVATEGQGVWRFDPAAAAGEQWTQFTHKDGLGSDDTYALLVDARNRLWAGTTHGVSVYNGKAWKTYGPLEGLGGSRVFALAACPTTGDVWIATEGGLTRYLVRGDRWQQYSRQDGLPSDSVQALAFNKTGDLFVGTQSDGIAVASARSGYQNWRTVRGPIHLPDAAGGAGLPTSLINCLHVVQDGTVYAGTTAGLARSSDNGKTWRFLRGADWVEKRTWEHPQAWQDAGLVDNADVRALEVVPRSGTAVRIAAGGSGEGDWEADHDFTGGQTFHTSDSIDASAVLDPAPQSVYQSARWGSFTYTISRLKPGVPCRVRLHLAEVAYDKPGQRIFNVAVNGRRVLTYEDIRAEAGARDKVIVKEFMAAADAHGRLILSFRGSGPLPSSEKHSPYELAEDYVTALAEDGAGHLLVGHRQKGLEVLDTQTGRHLSLAGSAPPRGFVTALLPRPNGTLLVAGYGIGLSQMPIIGTTFDGVFAPTVETVAAASPALPTPAAAPTLAQLNAMLRVVTAVPLDKGELQPHVVPLPDDWLTEGDWLGRYGRYWACDPACCSPYDYYWGAGWRTINYSASIGPNRTADDGLRYWVQTLYTTDPHCLELPPTYLDSRVQKGLTTPDKNRRDSSQDDHGETYPMAMEGPNVYQTVRVPPGLYVLSLYFFNRQYADGPGDRDYRLSVRPQPEGARATSLIDFSSLPEWANGRVVQHYAGVWKRFLVRGPQSLTVEVDRNHSWNTELDGITLDLLDELPPPYFGEVSTWNQAQLHPAVRPQSHGDDPAARLLDALTRVCQDNSRWWTTHSRQDYLALSRWYNSQPAGIHDATYWRHLASCCYGIGLYQRWEDCLRLAGLTPARDVEKALHWNGISDEGQDYQVVRDYLAVHAEKRITRR